MTILTATGTTKTINYFNRIDTTPFTVNLKNEATNVRTNFNVVSVTADLYFDSLTFTVSSGYFIEDNFYMIKILDVDGNIIFKDKIFVTNQTGVYNINNNRYEPNVTTNEYTIYE